MQIMVRNKKAQMKIQQMAFMLMAITLFFVLTGMFIMVIKFSGLKKTATVLEEKNAMLLVTKLANSPEFACGEAFGSRRINCIDADKAMVLRENIKSYENFWGVSNIEIRKIYPIGDETMCTIATYPDCNVIRMRPKNVTGFDLYNYVSLCRKEYLDGEVYDKCELAKIMASYEAK